MMVALVQSFFLRALSLKEDISVISPQNCSLDCIVQGDAVCEYCRITREDVSTTLGVTTEELLGSCVPWPCDVFLGAHAPAVCHHYVHAPYDVTVDFLPMTTLRMTQRSFPGDPAYTGFPSCEDSR
ncbi:hypothetical protein AAFF_G00295020 [Aldrovandia affinis]|uniref:Uncharacterized protein n=1 Tax=Aldrovandia affinis TaxID=143900 RepID=A0AAD7R968_9TELE|nr:hypothetical protein AAFF_G00295020 [Aldrovandia affinis]